MRGPSCSTSSGGTILVAPYTLLIYAIPSGGLTLPFNVPNQQHLCGFPIFLQMLQQDSAAVGRLSFTAGLELGLGYP